MTKINVTGTDITVIPAELALQQTSIIYANETDVLNVTLFGITAKEWRKAKS